MGSAQKAKKRKQRVGLLGISVDVYASSDDEDWVPGTVTEDEEGEAAGGAHKKPARTTRKRPRTSAAAAATAAAAAEENEGADHVSEDEDEGKLPRTRRRLTRAGAAAAEAAAAAGSGVGPSAPAQEQAEPQEHASGAEAALQQQQQQDEEQEDDMPIQKRWATQVAAHGSPAAVPAPNGLQPCTPLTHGHMQLLVPSPHQPERPTAVQGAGAEDLDDVPLLARVPKALVLSPRSQPQPAATLKQEEEDLDVPLQARVARLSAQQGAGRLASGSGQAHNAHGRNSSAAHQVAPAVPAADSSPASRLAGPSHGGRPAAALPVKAGEAAAALPSDVLRMVLLRACREEALPTAAAVHVVCKAWREVARGLPELWAHLNLVREVRHKGELVARPYIKLSNAIVRRLAVDTDAWRHVRSVQFLERSGSLTETALQHLAQGCPLLSSLDLTGCTELRADGVAAALESMHALTSLNLSFCTMIPRRTGLDKVIRAAVTPRPGRVTCGLQTLIAAGCPTLSRAAMQALMAPPKGASSSGTPHLLELRHLDLTDSGNLEGRLQLSPEGLQACAPHLQVLKLTGLGGVFGWDVSFMRPVEPPPQGPPPDAAHAVAAGAAAGPAHEAGAGLGAALQPASPTAAVAAAVGAAAEGFAAGEGSRGSGHAGPHAQALGWPDLQVLELGASQRTSVTGATVVHSSLTNSLLLRLAQRSAQLHTLDLSGCQYHTLTPAALGQLSCRGSLRVLLLRKCSLGCDEGLQQVAQHFGASLEELDVSGCGGAVTDAGVEALAVACPQLRVLDLSGSAVEEKGLRCLLEHCPWLHSLAISSCRSLSRSVRMAVQQHTQVAGSTQQAGGAALAALRSALGM